MEKCRNINEGIVGFVMVTSPALHPPLKSQTAVSVSHGSSYVMFVCLLFGFLLSRLLVVLFGPSCFYHVVPPLSSSVSGRSCSLNTTTMKKPWRSNASPTTRKLVTTISVILDYGIIMYASIKCKMVCG